MRNPQARFQPAIEVLEERWALSTFMVVNAADNGVGSFRAAVARAVDGDTIVFHSQLQNQSIRLTSGTIFLNKSINVVGLGANQLTIQGNGTFRLFEINDGTILDKKITFSGITLKGGFGDGGAIRNFEDLKMTDCVVSGNQAIPNFGTGGGIYNFGPNSKLELTRVTVSNNSARYGGGIANDGTAIITDSTISGNLAAQAGNFAFGGGILNRGDLTMTRSTISGNVAGSTAVNSSAMGGGLHNAGDAVLTNCTISGNIVNGPSGAYGGGGIAQNGAIGSDLTLRNSTVTANVDNTGGGGGGIRVYAGAAGLHNTIVAGNTTKTNANGPDLNNVSPFGAMSVHAINSLFGKLTPTATLATDTNNLKGTLAAPIDPKLGALKNNGGATATHALIAGSPAINAGQTSAAFMTTFDQRSTGFKRVIDGAVDIGAYEYQSPATQTTLTMSTTNAILGQTVTFTAQVAGLPTNSNQPQGTVNFVVDGRVVAIVPLVNGKAQFSMRNLSLGAHQVKAVYTGFSIGDYRFDPSASAIATLNVRR